MYARRLVERCVNVLSVVALLMTWPLSARAALNLWGDTFEDGNTNGWTIQNQGAVIAVDNTMGNNGTKCLKVTGNSGAGQGAFAYSRVLPCDFTRDYTVQCAFRYTDFHWDRFLVFGHVRLLLDQPGLPLLYDPVGDNSFVGNTVSNNGFNSYLASSRWGWITVHCRPALRKYSVFIDGTLVGTVNYQGTVAASNQLWFEDNHSVSNFLDARYDDFSVLGYQTPQSYSKPTLVTDPENNPAAWAQPPGVPYHGQYTVQGSPLSEPCCPPAPNGRCAVACLQMFFDRFGDVLPVGGGNNAGPQEEIEASANTNDRVRCPNGLWAGTALTDSRRGGHFSGVTQALTRIRQGCPPQGCPQRPGRKGYTWRDLGYSAVDSVWRSVAPTDTVDLAHGIFPTVLETFLGSGYPIMACISTQNYLNWIRPDSYEGYVDTITNPPEVTTVGHAVLLVGYDNVGNCPGNPWGAPAFLLHDPAVCKYGWVPQGAFWTQIWTSKRFLFTAPWELRWLSPNVWCYGGAYDGTLLVTYTGAAPLNGLYPVRNAQAKVTLTNIGLQGGEVQTHNLNNIARTGDWDFTTWKLKNAGWPGQMVNGTVVYSAWGTLNPAVASRSYANYADKLGGKNALTQQLKMCVIISPPPHDPGHGGWPYPGIWWERGQGNGSGSGSALSMRPLGGSIYGLYATIQNLGEEPIPAGTTCRFYYQDPNVAERAPGGTAIGEVTVPPLAYGDTLTVGPVTWTRPPQNGFGEPYFTIFSSIQCSQDPPVSDWPQDENNYATLSEYGFDTDTQHSVSMEFRVDNPEPTSMVVVLQVERDEAASEWGVSLSLPEGAPITLGPSQSIPCRVTVLPTEGDSLGTVHVECFLYTPGMELVRETGGIGLMVHVESPSGVSGPAGIPQELTLLSNIPNPFGTSTTIRYALPHEGKVRLQVFDVSGRLVQTIVSDQRSAGPHQESWAGKDDRGRAVANGIYFYRLKLDGGEQRTRGMIVLR